MKVLVTGAGGFLGRVVVAEAVAAGHEVKAMHRPASLPQAGAVPAGVMVVPGDLRQPGIWRDALGDVDAVIHCAAAASGDIATQLAGTVLATENLLAALEKPEAGETIVNLVDDEQPTHWGYHHRSRRAGAPVGLAVPIPYLAVRALGALAWGASRTFFRGRARLPEWLDLPRQEVRWRPMRYRNAEARRHFGRGAVALEEGVRETVQAAPRIGRD